MAVSPPALEFIVGHRGAAGEAPENTLGGFQYAKQLGLQHYELDVHLSGDNKLVVLHDNTVNRTTFSKGKVGTFTTSELAQMDARRNAPPWPKKEGIPLLETVIDSLQPTLRSVQLEVKSPSKDAMLRTCDGLIELIESKNLLDTAIVTSSDKAFLQRIYEAAPHIRRGYVAEWGNPLPTVDKFECQYLIPDWHLCKPALVTEAHERDVIVSVWTVNDLDLAKQLYQLGVDSLITDYPSRMLSLIEQLLIGEP